MKPEAVLRAERLLGGEAAAWRRADSRGWTQDEHWTVVLRDGTRAFLKEASIAPSPDWLRQELEVLRLVRGPFAPALRGFDDGERPLLVLEDLGNVAGLEQPDLLGRIPRRRPAPSVRD